MIKKTIISYLMICFLFILLGCSNNNKYVKYKVGESVIKDGIIYEYSDISAKSGNVFSFETADEDVLYHDYYYYDMSNPNQDAIIPFGRDDHTVEYNDIVVKATSCSYYYGPKYFETHKLRRNTWVWDSSFIEDRSWQGFMIKGYTDKIKDNIVVPKQINGNYVLGVGYKALKNAPIKSLVFQGISGHILPFGLDGLPNLETLILPKYPILFSMSIANCFSLTQVTNIYSLNDASLYNLPNLRKIHYTSMLEKPSSTSTSYLTRISFGVIFGIYRSSFYLCPNIEEITINQYPNSEFEILESDNVIYCKYRGKKRILYVKNNYHINLNDLRDEYWMVDEEENSLYVPFLNDGFIKKGTISYEENDFIKEIDGQIYYRLWVEDNWASDLLTSNNFFIFRTEYHV